MKPILFALLLALALPAHATVTAVRYWRMGDNDPGATALGSCTNTTDFATNSTLSNTPVAGVYPYYTTNVAAGAASVTGSKFAVHYSGGQYGTAAPILNLASNFGAELWVKPDNTTTNESLVYNGNSSTTGWGLYQYGANFGALLGGQVEFGSYPVTTNTWTHLALVMQNGQTTFYVNGAAVSSAAGLPNPVGPTDIFRVAANLLGGERFNGSMDELRVFTFATGAFTTNDFLLPPPAPAPSPQVLFSTFGPNFYVSTADDAAQGVSSTFFAAEPFVPTGTAVLGQIVVPVYCFTSPNQIRFTLTTSSNSLPGSALETWSISNLYTYLSPDPTLLIRVLPSVNHPILAKGVQYWLYASTDNPGTESWWVINPNYADDPRGAAYSTNAGASWAVPEDEGIQPAYELDAATNAYITSITASGANLTLTAVDGVANLTYVTLMGTNLAEPLESWQPVFTNVLTNSGSFTVPLTNALNSNASQEFYVIRTSIP